MHTGDARIDPFHCNIALESTRAAVALKMIVEIVLACLDVMILPVRAETLDIRCGKSASLTDDVATHTVEDLDRS